MSTGFPKTPLKSIGARDIIKLEYEKSGHLRKEGFIERSLLGKFVHWRQYFVVLRDGCCYIFETDRSSQPKTAFSFENYCRLECFDKPPDYDYCFKLIPRPRFDDLKEHCFAASDESSRQEWLIAIFKALHVANNLPEPPEVNKRIWNEDIFVKLKDRESGLEGDNNNPDERQQQRRKYTKMPTKPLSRSDSCPLPPTPIHTYDYDEIPEDSDSDTPTETYDDCNVQRNPSPLKAKPRLSFVPNRKSSLPTPTIEDIRSLPTTQKADERASDTTRKDSHINQDSKEKVEDLPLFKGSSLEAKRIIKEQSVGTFLIRPSSQSGTNIPYVLVVSARTEEVQFRIHRKEGGKIYLNEGVFFNCLSELVEHYRRNDLSVASRIRLTKHHGHMEK